MNMSKKQSQYMWVYKPSAPKFTAPQKTQILTKTKEMIKAHSKISQKVSRVDMRANRIYLYELCEQIKSLSLFKKMHKKSIIIKK
jgi:hypothetical protein